MVKSCTGIILKCFLYVHFGPAIHSVFCFRVASWKTIIAHPRFRGNLLLGFHTSGLGNTFAWLRVVRQALHQKHARIGHESS